MEMNYYNSWNFQLVDVLFPTLDVYSDDLFDAAIKTDIVIDGKNCKRIGQKEQN